MLKKLRDAGVITTCRLFLPILIFCLCPELTWSDEVQRLSQDEAVKLAIENNLGLEAERISTATKKRNSDMAWNVLIPTVEASGTFGRLNVTPEPMVLPLPPLLGGPISVSMGEQWRLLGSLSLSLNVNFGLFEAMRTLKKNYEAGLLSYEKAKLQLERDVRKSYFQIQLLQENLNLLKENLDAATKRAAMAEANYNAGLVPKFTMLQAKVALENLKPVIYELENGIITSMAAFGMNLGLPFGTQIELIRAESPKEYITLNQEEITSKAISARPEMLELQKNIDALKSRKKAVTMQIYTPTLALGWNWDPTFQGDPTKDSWFSNDWKQSSGMFRVTLAYRLSSLLPFSSEAQSLKDLDATIRTLEINMGQLMYGTEVEILNTILKLEKSMGSIDTLKMNVDLAEQSYKLTEEAFQAGLLELLDVQNADIELQKARLEVIKEDYNYVMSLLDLEYAMGVPFGTLSSKEKR